MPRSDQFRELIAESLVSQTDALITTIDSLTDLETPSLCTGWTRAHVLTHLSRNADGLANLVRAAHGEALTMYLSDAARDEDIESGARRSPDEIRADAVRTAHEILEALGTLSPDLGGVRVERTPGGQTFRALHLPFLRLREVVYHHVDLDAGFGFTDLPTDLQELFLTDELERLDHAPTVSGSRAGLLAWLARGIPDGLDSTHAPTQERPS